MIDCDPCVVSGVQPTAPERFDVISFDGDERRRYTACLHHAADAEESGAACTLIN